MERAATYDFFKLLNFRKQSTSNRSARKITAEEIAIIKSKLFVIAHILFRESVESLSLFFFRVNGGINFFCMESFSAKCKIKNLFPVPYHTRG
jgi:hypothetical protein